MDQNKVVAYLWDKHRIIVSPIVHKEFACVRVTPNVYTTATEMDRFGDVMEDVLKKGRSEEHTSELQSRQYLVCRLLLEKKKRKKSRRLDIRRWTRHRQENARSYVHTILLKA